MECVPFTCPVCLALSAPSCTRALLFFVCARAVFSPGKGLAKREVKAKHIVVCVYKNAIKQCGCFSRGGLCSPGSLAATPGTLRVLPRFDRFGENAVGADQTVLR